MKRKFTLTIKHYLLNRIIEETIAKRLTPYNFYERLRDDQLEVMGIEVLKEPVTLAEQDVAAAFTRRREIAVKLAVKFKIIKAVQIAQKIGQTEYLTSIYVPTKFGLFFRRIPFFAQRMILFIFTSTLRLIETANKFKWLAGIISFITLSFKVWHSGLIDSIWIGISLSVGLGVTFLLSLWD
ncbi:hypothetical protein [Plesiomonas sp. ZOR0011]|uniref:hypothetical protein n=1 Tax=Plesiomonas sp. ZOR0011 TaxID=1339230 RepID=UPI000648E2D9|nr:hypothetical protein [Plesiomonas sp. ZOR0011]